jgi:O-methyltransferase involved in polyketide biosynthesis
MTSKGPNPLIDDPYAEPLVRAVGVDAFVKLANGEIDFGDDALSHHMMAEGISDEKSQERRERMRSLLNVDMSELVYQGERNHVIDYLTARGWDVTASGTPELYAANGFTLPDDDAGAAMTNVQYISATLQQGA